MKAIAMGFLGILAITGAWAQTKTYKDSHAQTRTVTSFHGIHLSNGIHLYLSQGNEEAVAVSASEQRYIDKIKTEVVDGILDISYDHSNWTFWGSDDSKQLKAYVSCKTMDKLKASSGSEVEVDGLIHAANSMDLSVSSGATFRGRVEAPQLTVKQSSGAQTTISGKAPTVSVEASSGSSFDGYELDSEHCEARASSGASVQVTVQKDLNASASSGGQIHYRGNGMISSVAAHSGGEVNKN